MSDGEARRMTDPSPWSDSKGAFWPEAVYAFLALSR